MQVQFSGDVQQVHSRAVAIFRLKQQFVILRSLCFFMGCPKAPHVSDHPGKLHVIMSTTMGMGKKSVGGMER